MGRLLLLQQTFFSRYIFNFISKRRPVILTSIFNYYLVVLNGALIGFMLFFVVVVSPVVFKTLSQDEAARFLRAVFPRLFLAGLLISLAMVTLSLFGKELDFILISCVITAGFAKNYFILTPNINKARDAVLAGDEQMGKQFKIFHLLSVLIFVAQVCLSMFVVVTHPI